MKIPRLAVWLFVLSAPGCYGSGGTPYGIPFLLIESIISGKIHFFWKSRIMAVVFKFLFVYKH
jgi:hypothetical protein